MLQALALLAILFQAGPAPRPSIVAKPAIEPIRNFLFIYYDDSFLFGFRHYGDSRDFGGSSEPGLFVHSKEHNRWIQILQISTLGGRFGKSDSDDPEVRKRMEFVSVGWNYTRYAHLPYIDQPMHTSGSLNFPELIKYDSSTGQYELRYNSDYKIPSVETVLYVDRKDLVDAFAKQPWSY
ncbi:MAG TPA: hypothetical protein VKJ45_03105 [Blastocatellia bacterium]|nr:hypothetical protein [Blastocatellia bacterium]